MKKITLTEKEILELIKNDLKITKLISVFHTIGFVPDKFDMYQDGLVFKSIGLSNYDMRLDGFIDEYMKMIWKVKEIDIISCPEQLDNLAAEIYHFLMRVEKRFENEQPSN